MNNLISLKNVSKGIFDCPHSTPKWTSSGIIVIRNQNIRNGRLDLADKSYTDYHHYSLRIRRAKPEEGDLIITREAPMGEVCRVPAGLICCLGQRMVLIKPDLSLTDSKYLLYAIQSPRVQHEIHISDGTGSTVSNLRIPLIEELKIPFPPLPTQRAIAHILGTLDDKIELNRRMNETLESIARALFKSWFIDFDPVRAKAEGRQPEGMDAATAALFPSDFETVEGQEIPKGWKFGTLGEIINIYDNKRIPLSSEQRRERKGEFSYYGATSIVDYIDDYIYDDIYVLLAEDGASVIDNDGKPFLQYVWGKFWVNNHAHVIQGKGSVSTEMLLQCLKNIIIKPYVTGAVQLKISQQNLIKIPIIIPNNDICKAYSKQINVFYTKIRQLNEEETNLISLRDTLLPKLLSGELPITNPEQFTGVS